MPSLKMFSWQDVFLSVYLFISLGYLLVAGANTNNTALIGISATFLLLFIGAIIAVIYQDEGNFPRTKFDLSSRAKQNNFISSLSFLVGFISMLYLTSGGTFSLIDAYSSIQTGTDEFIKVFTVTFAAPVAEEFYFMVGAFIVIIAIFNLLAKAIPSLKFLSNKWVQLIGAPILNAVAFAAYHTNQTGLVQFFIAAMAFRLILNIISASESAFNIVPFINASFLFAVGVHMANNINAIGGFSYWFSVMSSNLIGIVALIFIALNIYAVIEPFLFGRKVKINA